MRIVLFLTVLAIQTASAFAQDSLPACDGDIAIVRVSRILPGGSMRGFMAAVAAHKAWYRANGVKDNEIVASRVLVKDEKTDSVKYSDTEVLTYHVRPPAPERTPNRGNESWNAYVKQYRDNSEIKSEYMTGMPKFAR